MPHLTLEYTGNITEEISFAELFSKLHQMLSEEMGIKRENLKSRAVKLDDYYVANGDASHAFVHLDLRLLEGRSQQRKEEIGQKTLEILAKCYAQSKEDLRLQITVQVQDMQRSLYFKLGNGLT